MIVTRKDNEDYLRYKDSQGFWIEEKVQLFQLIKNPDTGRTQVIINAKSEDTENNNAL